MTGKQNFDTNNDSQVTVISGDNVVLQFTINSLHEVVSSMSWFHKDENLMNHAVTDFNLIKNIGRYTSTIETLLEIKKQHITLHITKIKSKDAGIYSCEVYFQSGNPVFNFWILLVQGISSDDVFGMLFLHHLVVNNRSPF